jgi:putative colanic acid biosynthesis acetyltransferase WcaF
MTTPLPKTSPVGDDPGPLGPDGAGLARAIDSNRKAQKWSRSELAARFAWDISQPLFAFSPRQFWVWRRMLLRLFGAKIGARVHVHPTARIAVPWNLDIGDRSAIGDNAILYSLGQITIGPASTISQGAHLCAGTHDHRRADLPLVKTPISVGEGAWICADAFVGPGANIGDFAIVGARAVVMGDVTQWTIVAGNPAELVGPRPRFLA